MASTIMHLSIAKELGKSNFINDISRFRIGQILPDAISEGSANHADSHYKITVCEGKKRYIDFESFYNEFKDKIMTDDLYLGYYLHLVEDGVYRKFLYYDYSYPLKNGNVDLLHNDYRMLNPYIVAKYSLKNNLQIPDRFMEEEINKIYSFNLSEFIKNISSHFEPYDEGSFYFFTKDMVDEYISKCNDICKKELEGIKKGRTLLNAMDYAWDK